MRAIFADASRHYVSRDTEVDETLRVIAGFVVRLEEPTHDLRVADVKDALIKSCRNERGEYVEWRVFFDHEGRLWLYGEALETHLRRESINPGMWDMQRASVSKVCC